MDISTLDYPRHFYLPDDTAIIVRSLEEAQAAVAYGYSPYRPGSAAADDAAAREAAAVVAPVKDIPKAAKKSKA